MPYSRQREHVTERCPPALHPCVLRQVLEDMAKCSGVDGKESSHPAGESELMGATSSTETDLFHQRIVDRVARHVDRHLAEALTLDELAAAGRLSKFHLHRVIISRTGLTPAQFVATTRMRRAMTLLGAARRERAPARIIDVALDVGFGDPSAFARSFRAYFGQSPREVLRKRPSSAPWWSMPRPRQVRGYAAQVVQLEEFYCYGHEAVGEHARTFARQAPQAFSLTFDTVERHGIEEVVTPMALPRGVPWALPADARLLCAFHSSRRLKLPQLTEDYVPPGRYLHLRHVGPYESRWQAWHKLAVLRRQLGLTGPAHGDTRRPFEQERPNHAGETPVADVFFPV